MLSYEPLSNFCFYLLDYWAYIFFIFIWNQENLSFGATYILLSQWFKEKNAIYKKKNTFYNNNF